MTCVSYRRLKIFNFNLTLFIVNNSTLIQILQRGYFSTASAYISINLHCMTSLSREYLFSLMICIRFFSFCNPLIHFTILAHAIFQNLKTCPPKIFAASINNTTLLHIFVVHICIKILIPKSSFFESLSFSQLL